MVLLCFRRVAVPYMLRCCRSLVLSQDPMPHCKNLKGPQMTLSFIVGEISLKNPESSQRNLKVLGINPRCLEEPFGVLPQWQLNLGYWVL